MTEIINDTASIILQGVFLGALKMGDLEDDRFRSGSSVAHKQLRLYSRKGVAVAIT